MLDLTHIKHALYLHTRLCGGYSADLCRPLFQIIDVLDLLVTDRPAVAQSRLDEIALLVVVDAAQLVAKAMEAGHIDATELVEHTMTQAGNIDRRTAKIAIVEAIAMAQQKLCAETGEDYVTITDHEGHQLPRARL